MSSANSVTNLIFEYGSSAMNYGASAVTHYVGSAFGASSESSRKISGNNFTSSEDVEKFVLIEEERSKEPQGQYEKNQKILKNALKGLEQRKQEVIAIKKQITQAELNVITARIAVQDFENQNQPAVVQTTIFLQEKKRALSQKYEQNVHELALLKEQEKKGLTSYESAFEAVQLEIDKMKNLKKLIEKECTDAENHLQICRSAVSETQI